MLYNESFATNKEFIMSRKRGSHLTYRERCHIQAYLESGKSHREIAKLLNCSHTAINNEIHRNQTRYFYHSDQAHELSLKRQSYARKKPYKLTSEMRWVIQFLLEEYQWSPVQISGRLKKMGGPFISHETIYTMIWKDKKEGGTLYFHLRHRAKKYHKQGHKKSGRGLIPGRIDISLRPEIVEQKSRVGDFELDTIIGSNHKGAIVSAVDRATKFTRLILVERATAKLVTKALKKSLLPFKEKKMLHTFTSDNGKEFAGHAKITKALGGKFFFARPYHSWERGLNEHTNGLVRQYFPKGTNFSILTPEQVHMVEYKLNNRPRKCLNFLTPCEAFDALSQIPLSGNFLT